MKHAIHCGKPFSSQIGDVTLGRMDTASLDKQHRKNGKDHTTLTRNVCTREEEGNKLKSNFLQSPGFKIRPKVQE